MFDLAFAWRIWRHHKWFALLLTFAFAVLGGLLAWVFTLARPAFSDRPDFVGTSSRLATIGLEYYDGRLRGASLLRLNDLQSMPGIQDVATLGIYSIELSIGEHTFSESAAFVSGNFSAMLDISELKLHNKDLQNVGFVTDWFWREKLHSRSIDGQVLLLGKERVPIRVIKVLPREFNQIGTNRVAVWLHRSNIQHVLDVKVPRELQGEVARILREAESVLPIHFAVVSLAQGFSLKEIKQTLITQWVGELQTTGGTTVYSNYDNLTPTVLPGFELAPMAKRTMQNHWWLLFGLVVLFGLTTVVSLLLGIGDQVTQRLDELNTRIILGAMPKDLVKQFSIELMPIWAIATLIGLYLAHVGTQYLAVSAHLLGSGVTWYGAFLASLVLAVLIWCSICWIILATFGRDQSMNRKYGHSATRAQTWLGRINLISQTIIVSCVAVIAVAASWQQWKNFRIAGMPSDIEVWRLYQEKDLATRINTFQLEQFIKAQGATAAWSDESWVYPNLTLLEFETSQEEATTLVSALLVSRNFFPVLGLNPTMQGNGQHHTMVVNDSAARQLKLMPRNGQHNETLYSLRTLARASINKGTPIEVVDQIPNIPHFGNLYRERAMVYVSLPEAQPAELKEIYVYAHKTQANAVNDALSRFVQKNAPGYQIDGPKNLKRSLDNLNDLQNGLFYKLAITLGVLLLALGASSLFHQTQRYVVMEKVRFGIMLAVGAQDRDIFHSLFWGISRLCILGWFSAMLVLYWLSPVFTSNVHLTLFDFPVVIAATLIVLFVVALSTALPFWEIVRQPVYHLLRYDP